MSAPKVNAGSADWRIANRWRMQNYHGPKATGPGGMEIEASAYVDVQPPGSDDLGILDRPQDFIKHPKPGCTYVWRSRQDDDTIRMVELHMMKPVLWSELVPETATISLYSFQESGIPDDQGNRHMRTYVGWRKFALFEVGPELSYKWFQQPADYHMHLVTKLPEQAAANLEPFGTATLKAGEKRTAQEEALRDQRSR
jgi:hypothetical protein